MLVGSSNAAALVYGVYRTVVLTLQGHALHAGYGWYRSPSIAVEVTLGSLWLCSLALLIPASSIGASELVGQGRGGRPRAAAFVALLCMGVVAQYCANLAAENSRNSPFVRDSWLHDGRSWFVLMCLLAIVMFVGTVTMLKSAGVPRPAATA